MAKKPVAKKAPAKKKPVTKKKPAAKASASGAKAGPEVKNEPARPTYSQVRIPKIGEIVLFHTTVRRAGLRDAKGWPSIVQKVHENGQLDLVVFGYQRVEFKTLIGYSGKNDEYWGPVDDQDAPDPIQLDIEDATVEAEAEESGAAGDMPVDPEQA